MSRQPAKAKKGFWLYETKEIKATKAENCYSLLSYKYLKTWPTKQNKTWSKRGNKQENITFINACGSDYPNLLLGLNHFFSHLYTNLRTTFGLEKIPVG